jgi:hypothetical protein
MTEGYGGTTMRIRTSVLGLVLLVPWLLLRGQGLADQRPGQHTHEGQTYKYDTWEKPPSRMRTPGTGSTSTPRRPRPARGDM